MFSNNKHIYAYDLRITPSDSRKKFKNAVYIVLTISQQLLFHFAWPNRLTRVFPIRLRRPGNFI